MSHRGKDLPDTIALFPLRGAALFPRARLPLNIFEPRYLEMTSFSLASGRIIGMIQPQNDDDINPQLYTVGCAGRIVSFSETGDGRFLIELLGISRFRLLTDHLTDGNFRLGEVDWAPYTADLSAPLEDTECQRPALINHLEVYLRSAGLSVDWDTIDSANTDAIVNSVAMSCPFEPDEKQALLEATTLTERIKALTTIMEIATAEALDTDSNDTLSRIQ